MRFPDSVYELNSLWDVNKDVLAAMGRSDEAVTLWPGEVLAHALEHGTWVSSHRAAGEQSEAETYK